jgi:alkylhydroperoxidase family enzyme
MTTIRLPDPADAGGPARRIFEAILARESRVFGATTVSNVWRSMGHLPDYLEANWARSRALMQRGRFAPLQRELIATAVSASNRCHY